MPENEKTSLSKYLSLCGVASRRKSCELIKQGKVLVNRLPVVEPGFKISPDDEVVCNGKKIFFQKKIYILLNKPRGFICTADDPHAPQKAVDLIKLPPEHSDIRIFSAGRLDKDSEGLLIFTNDGDYAEKIMHPRYGILKTYEVKTAAEIPAEILNRLRGGITDDGELLHPEEITREEKCRYTFILNEGKKREIRRMVNFAGTQVTSLKRVALGKLKLGNLKPGQWKYLTEEEVRRT
ncbi:MAG: pseudouridine synthase [Victivallales bacterium]